MNIFCFLFLPIWIVLLVDGGLKLLLLAIRVWGKPRGETFRSVTAPARWFSIGIVIPAHNEAGVIGETVRQLMQLRYPADCYAVVVIADGCTDQTANRACEQGGAVCNARGAS